MNGPDLIQLTYENWCTLICVKKCFEVKSDNEFSIVDSSYDLLPAFREGFFADVIIKSANGTQVLEILFDRIEKIIY